MVGTLANLFVSSGEKSKVLKFEASIKKNETSKVNIITLIREAIKRVVDAEKIGEIGMGGVLLVESGKVKAHVMSDFSDKLMIDGSPEVVNEWLKYFEMGPKLTCFPVFLTGDPTQGNNLNLRLEHTHFFSRNGKEAGHFHFTVTPKEIKYVGYLNFAKYIYRIDNAYLEKFVPKF